MSIRLCGKAESPSTNPLNANTLAKDSPLSFINPKSFSSWPTRGVLSNLGFDDSITIFKSFFGSWSITSWSLGRNRPWSSAFCFVRWGINLHYIHVDILTSGSKGCHDDSLSMWIPSSQRLMCILTHNSFWMVVVISSWEQNLFLRAKMFLSGLYAAITPKTYISKAVFKNDMSE